jgi:hypothetical protein
MKNRIKVILKSFIVLFPLALFIIASCSDNGVQNISPTGNYKDLSSALVDSIAPGDFRTYGQGGWGAPPHGNNPGQYLKTHWNLLDTVIIGCDTTGGYTLTFTTWQAVNNFLPQGGKPAPLDTSLVNPNFRISVLAGQVLSLALNIEFDLADSSFGNSSTNLKDLCVVFGTFQGWTVEEVFMEANRILGGCSTAYSPSEINYAVSSINENFEDGQVGNYLQFCP